MTSASAGRFQPRAGRFWRVAAASGLGLAVLAGAACRKQAESDGRTVIRFLANPDVGGFSKKIIAAFESANPDMRVEMVEGPAATNIREDMYSASFMAGEDTYDLVYMDVVWLPKFAAQGWLRPLDDFFTKESQARFLPGDIRGSYYEGRIYRVPTQSDGGVLYYRKDLLEKNGLKPPQTWDELVAIAKRLQSPPAIHGLVFQGKQYEGLVCVFLELAWGNGGDVIDEQGNVLVDRPESVEALERLAAAVRRDKISPESVLTYQEEEARHSFQEGHAVFMRNWPYAYNLMQAEGSPVRGKFGIIPMVRGRGKSSAATLGGWGYGVSAFSKNPRAAWRFLEFAASVESQKTAFFGGGILPTLKSLFSDPELLKAAPHLKELGSVLENARPRPVHPSYARISDALQVAVSAALSGQKSSKDALGQAAKDIREVVAAKRP